MGKRSRPARALWIEILGASCRPQRIASRPARALWIEIQDGTGLNNINTSRPARALWIEIAVSIAPCPTIVVEAREGLVD